MGRQERDDARGDDERPRGLPDVPRIRLRAPSGVHIDYTLPLHEAIHSAWRKGEMQRVDDDGAPWPGDQYDVSGVYDRQREDREAADGAGTGAEDSAPAGGAEDSAPAGGAEDSAPAGGGGEPVRPADSAPKQAWQDYAAALGACSAEEAAGMSRGDLIKLCTPPEADPLTPGV